MLNITRRHTVRRWPTVTKQHEFGNPFQHWAKETELTVTGVDSMWWEMGARESLKD